MLELLDLRDRRARLELPRLEIDPHVSDTVRAIVARVRDEGDDVLLDLAAAHARAVEVRAEERRGAP